MLISGAEVPSGNTLWVTGVIVFVYPLALPEVGGSVALPDGMGMETYVAGIERSLLQTALNQSGGVQTKAADVLGISYRSFRHLMKKYSL